MKKNKNIYSAICLFLCFMLLVLKLGLASPSLEEQLFNSDALYLPALFLNLFHNGGQIRDWYLTPAPYFFPDYILYAVAYVCGKDLYSQIVGFALLQASFVLLIIWLLVREITSINKFQVTTIIFITLVFLATGSNGSFAYLLNSGYHYGVFLVGLFMVTLWLRYDRLMDKWRKVWILLLISGVAFLSALSDNLTIVQIIAPMVVACTMFLVINREVRFFYKKTFVILTLFSGVIGSISYNFIVAHKTRYNVKLGFDKFWVNFSDFIMVVMEVVGSNYLFALILIVYFILVARAFQRSIMPVGDKSEIVKLTIFSFFSFCITVGAMLIVTNLPVTSRYLIAAFSWPVIIFYLFINDFLKEKFCNFSLVASGVLLVVLVGNVYGEFNRRVLRFDYYPEEISCLDKALKFEKVNNGIAQYWDAKRIQMLSNENLNIAQYLSDLSEMPWITSEKFFRERYDFAIISRVAEPQYKISTDYLVRINGAPRKIYNCGNKDLYIYDKNEMRVVKFSKIGDSYTWKGCDLPSIIGASDSDCGMNRANYVKEGFVTYGPYEKLPVGGYHFEISYSSNSSAYDEIGNWDVLMALPQKGELIGGGKIFGTDGRLAVINGDFSINNLDELVPIEIRTYARDKFDLTVKFVKITRSQ